MTEDIIRSFQKNSDAGKAAEMKAYMRHQFDFFGIPSPLREQISKPLFAQFDLLSFSEKEEIVKALWDEPQRELQYFVMEAIARGSIKWPEEIHHLFDFILKNKSWWDTVDFIAVNCCGQYLRLFPGMRNQKLDEWQMSASFWLHRTALLFQLKYRESTDEQLLFKLCRDYADDPEFFIRKAIGWALRQYSKTNPGSVKKFIHSVHLSPLSIKEASKYLGKEEADHNQ